MRVVVLTLFAVLSGLGQVERVTFPEPVSVPDPAWKFTGGCLAAHEREGPGVALYRRDGTQLYETIAQVPDGALLRIRDVAALPDGRLVAAGHWSATNRGFLLLDETGEPVRAIDTYPFLPRRVTAGPGGDIWLLGTEPDDRNEQDLALRRYRRDGELILEALPLSEAPGGDVSVGWFGASNTSMGLWFPRPGVWLEFSSEGEEIARFPLRKPSGAVGGIVLNDAGEIHAGGDSLYRYNRKSRAWERSSEMTPEAPPLTLIGETGPMLVFRVIEAGPVELIFMPH